MSSENDQSTKEALLDNAVSVFAEKGYHAATVREICARANANVAAVNYHFGGKGPLYEAVLRKVFFEQDVVPDLTGESMPPQERLKAFIRALILDIYTRNHGFSAHRWSIFLNEVAKPSDQLDFIVRQQVQPRVDELRAIMRGVLGPDAPDEYVFFCSSKVWSLLLDYLMTSPFVARLKPRRAPMPENAEEVAELIYEFSLGGLQAIKAKTISPKGV
ncbi:CerR family C-terminal domain-containing protein [Pseudodesulfovibrio tunisiensis]|uniref:CerR family C-terminal domain-containing protein n=1 Tax=Pseudodesulfovibrio tunisiensis TaxID=463192 RepID=UPI001FB2A915|nr:CerR family C-terminal domain-containing protein [Pseudodesulfovibrio tunisiensis]